MLNASTLARVDKWTVPAGQQEDLDFGSSPTLFTGAFGWQQALPCGVIGTPVVNALTRVLAVAQANCPTGAHPSVRLFNEDTGAPLGAVASAGDVFAQPIFAEGKLFVAGEAGRLIAYSP